MENLSTYPICVLFLVAAAVEAGHDFLLDLPEILDRDNHKNTTILKDLGQQ